MILVAPVSEEIVFRGYVLSALRQRWSITTAVALSTLVFSLIHLPFFGPGLTVYMIPWSIVASSLFLLFDNLYASTCFHIVNNLCAYVILPALL